MRFAGKAYIMGIFGALGVGTAILGTAGIVVLIGERKIKKVISQFEKDMRARLEDLTGIPTDPCCPDCVERCTGKCTLCHDKPKV